MSEAVQILNRRRRRRRRWSFSSSLVVLIVVVIGRRRSSSLEALSVVFVAAGNAVGGVVGGDIVVLVHVGAVVLYHCRRPPLCHSKSMEAGSCARRHPGRNNSTLISRFRTSMRGAKWPDVRPSCAGG